MIKLLIIKLCLYICSCVHYNLGLVRHFNVFESLLYSQRLHLFDQKTNSNILNFFWAFLNYSFLFEYIVNVM